MDAANLTTNKRMMKHQHFSQCCPATLMKTGHEVKLRGNSLDNVETVIFTKLVASFQYAAHFQSGIVWQQKTYAKGICAIESLSVEKKNVYFHLVWTRILVIWIFRGIYYCFFYSHSTTFLISLKKSLWEIWGSMEWSHILQQSVCNLKLHNYRML